MRSCLIEPIPEIFEAANKLSDAVDAHMAGDRVTADQMFREANCPKVRAFTAASWGKGAKLAFALTYLPGEPPSLPRELQPRPRMPTLAVRREVIERDGYHCRFCGIPVIDPGLRSLAHSIYPEAIGWGRVTSTQHAAFQCMWMQFDHVLPNSRGGDSSIANVVITCAPCNFGRMEFTIREARLLDPLSRPTPVRWAGYHAWNGLEALRRAKD